VEPEVVDWEWDPAKELENAIGLVDPEVAELLRTAFQEMEEAKEEDREEDKRQEREEEEPPLEPPEERRGGPALPEVKDADGHTVSQIDEAGWAYFQSEHNNRECRSGITCFRKEGEHSKSGGVAFENCVPCGYLSLLGSLGQTVKVNCRLHPAERGADGKYVPCAFFATVTKQVPAHVIMRAFESWLLYGYELKVTKATHQNSGKMLLKFIKRYTRKMDKPLDFQGFKGYG
jgi:hypothetical protein